MLKTSANFSLILIHFCFTSSIQLTIKSYARWFSFALSSNILQMAPKLSLKKYSCTLRSPSYKTDLHEQGVVCLCLNMNAEL